MEYCDIHAHLADRRVWPQVEAILHEARDRGVSAILANAAHAHEWDAITSLSRRPGVFGALGLHPFFLQEWAPDIPVRLRQALGAHTRLRAVGEIGLDFQHGRQQVESQVTAFTAQCQVAAELGLPVIVHNRKSWSEFFAVLRSLAGVPLTGVCHHFSGSVEIARQVLDRGFDISFCGPLTYPNARRLKSVARYVPLDRVLSETDTPDLPPAAYRGQPSRPFHVIEVVRELAVLKGLSPETVAAQVAANFRRVLGMGSPSDAGLEGSECRESTYE